MPKKIALDGDKLKKLQEDYKTAIEKKKASVVEQVPAAEEQLTNADLLFSEVSSTTMDSLTSTPVEEPKMVAPEVPNPVIAPDMVAPVLNNPTVSSNNEVSAINNRIKELDTKIKELSEESHKHLTDYQTTNEQLTICVEEMAQLTAKLEELTKTGDVPKIEEVAPQPVMVNPAAEMPSMASPATPAMTDVNPNPFNPYESNTMTNIFDVQSKSL